MTEVKAATGFRVHHIVLVAVCAGIFAVASIATSWLLLLPGLGALYLPSGIIPPFTVWFGPWSLIGAALSGILYAPFWGETLFQGFMGGVADMLYGIPIWIIFKTMKLNPNLKGVKDYLGWLLGSIIGVLISEAAYIGEAVFWWGWYTFEVGFGPVYILGAGTQLTIGMVLNFLLMKALSPLITKSPLYVKGWLF